MRGLDVALLFVLGGCGAHETWMIERATCDATAESWQRELYVLHLRRGFLLDAVAFIDDTTTVDAVAEGSADPPACIAEVVGEGYDVVQSWRATLSFTDAGGCAGGLDGWYASSTPDLWELHAEEPSSHSPVGVNCEAE